MRTSFAAALRASGSVYSFSALSRPGLGFTLFSLFQNPPCGFEVTPHEILSATSSDRFVALMQFQQRRARDTYREAYALLPKADRRSQRPGLIMSAIYLALLEEIGRDGFRVLDHRVSLTPVRKLWIAWRTWTRARPPEVRSPSPASAT